MFMNTNPNPRRPEVQTLTSIMDFSNTNTNTNTNTIINPNTNTNNNTNNSKWIPKPSSEEKCQIRLLQKLFECKKQNILRRCFLLESNEFEVLEFYGDAYLYERVSYFIMTTRRFMDPNLMTKLRCSCIKNANLATVFEQLKLSELFETTPVNLPLKSKADVLEAIIGELAEDGSDISEDLLKELITYITYMGDKEYFQEANAMTNSNSVSPLAEVGPKKNNKQPRRRHRSRKGSGNSITGNIQKPDTPSTTTIGGITPTTTPIKTTPAVNSAPPAPSDKHPLFILLRPSINPVQPLPPKYPAPSAASLPPPPAGRIIRLEPNNMGSNIIDNRLPLLPNNSLPSTGGLGTNYRPVATVLSSPPVAMVGKELPQHTAPSLQPPGISSTTAATTSSTRNIFFHKVPEIGSSNSSESSSGSASLSSSPRNFFYIPNNHHPLGNGTTSSSLMKNHTRISDDLRLNEMKRL